MADTIASNGSGLSQASRPDRRILARVARRKLSKRLAVLRTGSLVLTLPDGSVLHHHGTMPGPRADLTLHRWRALWRILTEGDTGLAAAYRDGDCSSSDIKALIAFGATNNGSLTRAFGSSRAGLIWERLLHRLHMNTRRGSRRNIAAHYDLGNEFYAQWLDRTMNYSSALYSQGDQTLEEAQQDKLRRIAELLDVKANQRVLEIGFGWGALAEHLLSNVACSFTGLTLSREQLAYARQRLSPQAVTLRLLDYRDVEGRYDRVASIEMLEAVGERYWPTYFQKLQSCLSEDGIAVIQVITIAENLFESYRRRPDFIQRFIFPGGMLPTVEIIKCQAAEAGLEVTLHQDFGGSYARTLSEWRHRFLEQWANIAPLGFDDGFKRLWQYYLAYCEAGFETGTISVGLFQLRLQSG